VTTGRARLAGAICLVLTAGLPAGCGGSEPPGIDHRATTGSGRPHAPAQHRHRRHARRAIAATDSAPGLVAVDHIVDGDTLDLANGRSVRLLQIDTPETTQGECYAGRAEGRLASLVRPGWRIRLRTDPSLDRTDRYGRLLRYVYRGARNVNLALVRSGAATVWFYQGDRGRFAARLLDAERRARRAKLGLWRACPGTPVDPEQGADTGGAAAGSDRDCSDFSSQAEAQRFFKAHGGPRSDPDRLDADHNGVACESLK
jgi:micrococcal nuclease